MSDPLLSVIVRTRGRESLSEAIASVAEQRRDDVVLVVVDALGSLAPPDSRGLPMQWVSRGQPLHRSVAAQAGLDAVTTRLAMFLDDGDRVLPGHLDKLINALEHSPDAVLAHTGVELVSAAKESERQGVFDAAFEPWELLLGNRLPIHSALFDVARVRGGGARFDRQFDLYEDWDFWLQLSQLGVFIHVPGVSAKYRVGEDSSGVHRQAQAEAVSWRVWQKWWSRAPTSWWTRALREAARALDEGRHFDASQRELTRRLRDQHVDLEAASVREADLHRLLADHVAQLQQSRAEAAEARFALEKSDASLRWTQLALQDTRTAFDEAAKSLQSAHAAVAQSQAWADSMRSQLDTANAALAAVQLAQRRSEDELAAVRRSWAWRVAAPLRRLEALGHGARQPLASIKRGVWTRQAALRGTVFRQYQRWIAEVESPARAERAHRRLGRPVPAVDFSVLLPVFNPDLGLLDEAIGSVIAQSHPAWQLCIANDASTHVGVALALDAWAARDARIQVTHRDRNGHIAACTNSALELARGDWIAFLDQDDLLAPDALSELADAIAASPEAEMVFSDEDKIDAGGRRFEPHRKPGFSIELLQGQNMVGHLVAYRRSLLLALGGLREGFDGAQDHELALRASERLRPPQILHLPLVLYHWRVGPASTAARGAAKPYAVEAARRAVNEHLGRTEPGACAELVDEMPWLRVRRPLSAAGIAECANLVASAQGSDWKLVTRRGVKPAGEGTLSELLSIASRPGVGVAAGMVLKSGRIAEGAFLRTTDGRWEVLCAGCALGAPGPFGAARLARGCDAVTTSAMIVRRELWALWEQHANRDSGDVAFSAEVREAGWRIVWTPHAVFHDESRD